MEKNDHYKNFDIKASVSNFAYQIVGDVLLIGLGVFHEHIIRQWAMLFYCCIVNDFR